MIYILKNIDYIPATDRNRGLLTQFVTADQICASVYYRMEMLHLKLINRCQYYELDKKIKSIPIRSVLTNCIQKVQLNITFTNIYSQK